MGSPFNLVSNFIMEPLMYFLDKEYARSKNEEMYNMNLSEINDYYSGGQKKMDRYAGEYGAALDNMVAGAKGIGKRQLALQKDMGKEQLADERRRFSKEGSLVEQNLASGGMGGSTVAAVGSSMRAGTNRRGLDSMKRTREGLRRERTGLEGEVGARNLTAQANAASGKYGANVAATQFGAGKINALLGLTSQTSVPYPTGQPFQTHSDKQIARASRPPEPDPFAAIGGEVAGSLTNWGTSFLPWGDYT